MVRVAIVGAGASGIIAAIIASCEDVNIDLYEKYDTIGKKIAISGNGKCNISNINLSKENFFGNDKNFIENIFKQFGFEKFKNFCENIGLYLDIKSDGKVYPLSYNAKSVINIFEQNLKNSSVTLHLGKSVQKIKKINDKFVLYCENKQKKYDKVLICSGSLAYTSSNSAFGYDIAKQFGHNIIKPYPSLVQLESSYAKCSYISGVKVNAKIGIVSSDIWFQGDVLFTKYGLSGFAVLDISNFVSKMLQDNKRVMLSINLLYRFDRIELFNIFQKIQNHHKEYDVTTMLMGFIPKKLACAILSDLKIKKDKKIEDLSKKDMKMIVNQLLDWRFEITDTKGFRYAEVSSGGVDVSQINHKTMESKLVKNLYFAGELLDVTGKRGGFNLAFAWSSGYIAGLNIKKVENDRIF